MKDKIVLKHLIVEGKRERKKLNISKKFLEKKDDSFENELEDSENVGGDGGLEDDRDDGGLNDEDIGDDGVSEQDHRKKGGLEDVRDNNKIDPNFDPETDSHTSSYEEEDDNIPLGFDNPNLDINLIDFNKQTDLNLNINFDELFLDEYDQRLFSISKMLPNKFPTTEEIKILLNEKVPKSFNDIITFIEEKSPILTILKSIHNLEDVSGYETKTNLCKKFDLLKEKNFIDHNLFFIFSKKNKCTNQSVNEWNKKFVDSFSEEKIDFDKFSLTITRENYCFCTKEYQVYPFEKKVCDHGNNIKPAHYITHFSLLEIFSILLSDPEIYNGKAFIFI